MSKEKRLQVLLDAQELASLQQSARAQGLPLSEWVRDALRAKQGREATGMIGAKLDAVRNGAKLSFPIDEPDALLAEIETGRARSSR